MYIPHLRGVARLRTTLESVRDDAFAHRVVLVDNCSSDGSREMVCEEFPDVEIHRLGSNLGFGRALNDAVRACGGDPIVFLNDDIRCEPGFLRKLVGELEDDVDMVAGVLVQEDRPQIVDSAGVVAEKDTLMGFDYLHGAPVENVAGAPPPLGPTGAAAVFRRGAFEAVGGYDEQIFAYYEDLDLALRMRAAGFRCSLAPGARARHAYSATVGGHSSKKFDMTGWSRGYLLRRYGVIRAPRRAAQAVITESAICAGQMLRHGTAAGLRGRLRGWHAAAGLPPRTPPATALRSIPLVERIRLRATRRR